MNAFTRGVAVAMFTGIPVTLLVTTAVTEVGSAAHLDVEGGVLQTFDFTVVAPRPEPTVPSARASEADSPAASAEGSPAASAPESLLDAAVPPSPAPATPPAEAGASTTPVAPAPPLAPAPSMAPAPSPTPTPAASDAANSHSEQAASALAAREARRIINFEDVTIPDQKGH